MLGTLPPYSVASLSFPFRALAARAGRAQLGGEREVLLATFVMARLAAGAGGATPLPALVRGGRAVSARSWLASLTVPASARGPLVKLAAATAGDDRSSVASALRKVIEVTEKWLDLPSRQELERLAEAFAD